MKTAFQNLLLGATSTAAVLAGMPAMDFGDRAAVTRRKGKRSVANSRIIDYQRSGPFYRQTGTRNIADNTLPIIVRYWVHRFLHATKGWREYHGGELFHLPSAVVPRGWQLFRRSTWSPNKRERALGLVPRLNNNDSQRAPLAACYA